MSKKNRHRQPRARENRGAWNPDDEWEIHRQHNQPRQSTRRRWTPQPKLPAYRQQINQYIRQHGKKYPEAKNMVTEFMMGKFYMRPEVAIRFAEYARAAAKNGKEIGGLLRIKKSGDNFIAIDLKVFEQSASMAFFEMDGREMNKWKNAMKKEGRAAELAEWNSLIHSHPPGCAPFLSGTDLDQIKLFGHRKHFWSVIVESDTEQIMNLNWRVHFYHGGMAPDKDGMLAPATPPLLVKDMPVDLLPSDWKDIHEEVQRIQKADSSTFVGDSATSGRRAAPARPIGFQPPQRQGGYLIGQGTQSTDAQKLDRAGSELDAAIADLDMDDVPSTDVLEPLTEDDMVILREAGFNPEDMASLQAAMDSEFLPNEDEDSEDEEEVILLSEGSIVSVNEKAMDSYGGTEWADRVRDMVDSEFTVEAVTEQGHVVLNDGIVLTTDAVDVVQA